MGIGFVLILGSLMVLSFFVPTMQRLHPGKHAAEKRSVSGSAVPVHEAASSDEMIVPVSAQHVEGAGLDSTFGFDFSTGGDA